MRTFAILGLYIVLFWGLGFSPVLAQKAAYFPHKLIIKYEPDPALRSLKAKTGTDPKQQVNRQLAKIGASSVKPLWKLPATPRMKQSATANGLQRIFEISYSSNTDPAQLASRLSRIPGVEYAEPKYIRYMQYEPDDPVENPQKSFHHFDQAWDITKGSRNVTVAIVDGGVGYTHPDLDGKMWINQDEIPAAVRSMVDQNSDNFISSTEVLAYLQANNEDHDGDGSITLRDGLLPASSLTTGTDTDGNGFVDDLYGWDFWQSGGVNGQPVTEDNNPIHDGTDHGTHVTGIAAAETDNGIGIYGTGFNVRYIAIKAGGIPDNPSTPDDESSTIGFGFQGILYAAEQGADIINCSWGGSGHSQAEQDVIDYVNSLGAVVVGAAGNDGVEGVIYPAAYTHVLAVGSVKTNNSKAVYSNYGYKLDVLATGTGIMSTVFNNQIGSKTGTSMSTPIVSGLAGLIKSLHPSWGPDRIMRQIRATSVSVDANNPGKLNNKLGTGKADAYAAVNTNLPGLTVLDASFTNTQGEKLVTGEDGIIKVTLTNYGNSGTVSVHLSALTTQGISLSNVSQSLGTVATGDTLTASFGISLSTNLDLSKPPAFRIDFSGSGYKDFNIFSYTDIFYDVVAVNRIKTSFASNGAIGFADPLSGTGGVGFISRQQSGSTYTDRDNLLFEGGLMISVGNKMYDAVRDADGGLSRDFTPTELYKVINPGQLSDADGHASLSVNDSGSSPAPAISMNTYAFDDSDLSNVVFVQYTITNPSPTIEMRNIYVGLFNDWDIGNSSDNGAAFNAQDSILYLYDESPGSQQPLVAVVPLGPLSGALAIDNTVDGRPDSLTFGLYDGFTDAEKLAALKSAAVKTSASHTDVSAVVASGPYSLTAGASVSAGFIYAFGDNTQQMFKQIRSARRQAPFTVSEAGLAVSTQTPSTTRLYHNYPNPFRRTTKIRIDLSKPTHVNITVYDVLGRKIRQLADTDMNAQTYFITFDGKGLSSGVYFLRLKTDEGVQTIPMTLIK